MSRRWAGPPLAVGAAVLALLAAGVPQGAAAPASTPPASCATPPARTAGAGGIQWAGRQGHDTACSRAAAVTPAIPPKPSYDGKPPLSFHGGAVTGVATPGELTVTPVYWVPAGSTYSVPPNYETLINQFIADVATGSGTNTNVFSSVTEYHDAAGTHLSYALHAGAPITDTDPFPAKVCTPDTGAIWSDGHGYKACITNAQLVHEASVFTKAHGLPNDDLTQLYMYFLPEGVETCFGTQNGAAGGQCSINRKAGFCGYHAFESPPLVANMNFAVVDSPTGWTCSSDGGSNTDANQTPNGDVAADTEISVVSHEIIETITDPQGDGWYDRSGNEIADDCSYVFGDSASFQGAAGAFSNQTINGHPYFLQEEFSNANFAFEPSHACIQREAVIASDGTATFAVGAASSFTVSTAGFAATPALTASGTLPAGVTFVDNHDGTAMFAGTAAAGTGRMYPIVITAHDGLSDLAAQTFMLAVPRVPVFLTAGTTTFRHGEAGTFRVISTGPPRPGTITESGTLPRGVTFHSRGGGKGTLAGTATQAGVFRVRFTTSNALATTTVAFTLIVR